MIKQIVIASLLLIPSVVDAKGYKSLTDFQCMVANLYFEARSESVEGMKAVAKVTMNRFKSKHYPNEICAVIFQKKQFSWTHQLHWGHINRIATGTFTKLPVRDMVAYNNAVKIAEAAVKGKLDVPKLRGSMYYHSVHVKPKWSNQMQQVAVIGSHIFYKD